MYSSDLGRAHDTAKIIVSQNQVNSDDSNIKQTELAREQHLPGFEHKPVQAYWDNLTALGYTSIPRDFKVEGGESRNDMVERSGKLILQIAEEAFKPENQWKRILLASHTMWICESQNFAAHYNTGEDYTNREKMKNCSVSILEVEKLTAEGAPKPYKFNYVVVSDDAHLE